MKTIAALFALLVSFAAQAGEIEPRTVSSDTSSYTVTIHVSAVQDATSKFENTKKDAEATIGTFSTTESFSMPRPGGGYDVTYRFLK